MPPKKATKAAKSAGDVFADQVFALSGTLTQTRDEITTLIQENGGTVASTVTKKVTHLITTAEDFASGPSKVETAKKNGIFIVNEDWLHDSIKAGSAKKEDDYLLSKKRKAEDEEEEEEEEKKPAKKGKKAAAKKTKKEDEDEEEEEEEKPKAKKGAKGKAKAETAETAEEEAPVRKSARATKGKAKAAEDDDEDEDEEEEEEKKDEGEKKKIVIKGRAAVDSYCSQASNAHVLEEGGVIYDCMLNQTNIGNNNNKFYVIQLLEKDGGGQYWAWNRWGRVGEKGQNKLEPCGSNKAKAISAFEKKFYEKTKNRWADRGSFKTVSGKYTLIEIDYGADQEPEKEEKVEKKKTVKKESSSSKLDERVQDLVKLIFDLKMMENVMTEMEYDIKKMPLGKLTKKQIKDGYEVLKELDEAITKNKGSHVLEELSNRFYTLIPHALGRSKLPIIKNQEVVKSKMNMLEALADIEIATKLMKETDKSDDNPIDHNYAQLKCDIKPLDHDSEEYKQIATYVKNTHQNSTPKIKNIYRIDREGEKDRFLKQAGLGNRKLLWHGSRLTNYVGIISQGLRIAPPEAPVSGYRFGKGIYFADIMSLSSVYCRSGASNDFCMLLGDVALGKEAELDRDTYMEKPISGTHSTKALGKIEPSPKDYVKHDDGYIIPSGKIVDSAHAKAPVSCREHQYIVYDVSQVHLKYMLHLNWN